MFYYIQLYNVYIIYNIIYKQLYILAVNYIYALPS